MPILLQNQRHSMKVVTWGLIFLAAAVYIGCSETPEPSQPAAEGFSFFGLGANSLLTDSVRSNLRQRLGSEAITRRGIIALETNYPGFLKRYFPELAGLNQILNDPPMERVEHDITRLMFRYARQKGQPFHYVELIFSNHSSKPLFFKISAKADGPTLIDQLKEKYGRPETIIWSETEGKTLYWRTDRDVFMMSVVPNRVGEPEYHISIYYGGNLEQMIGMKEKASALREEALQRAGEKAF